MRRTPIAELHQIISDKGQAEQINACKYYDRSEEGAKKASKNSRGELAFWMNKYFWINKIA